MRIDWWMGCGCGCNMSWCEARASRTLIMASLLQEHRALVFFSGFVRVKPDQFTAIFRRHCIHTPGHQTKLPLSLPLPFLLSFFVSLSRSLVPLWKLRMNQILQDSAESLHRYLRQTRWTFEFAESTGSWCWIRISRWNEKRWIDWDLAPFSAPVLRLCTWCVNVLAPVYPVKHANLHVSI